MIILFKHIIIDDLFRQDQATLAQIQFQHVVFIRYPRSRHFSDGTAPGT